MKTADFNKLREQAAQTEYKTNWLRLSPSERDAIGLSIADLYHQAQCGNTHKGGVKPKAQAKELLKDFYVLQRDNMWGKAGEVVRFIKEWKNGSNQWSEWQYSDGTMSGLVACDLAYCISDKSIIPYWDFLNRKKK